MGAGFIQKCCAHNVLLAASHSALPQGPSAAKLIPPVEQDHSNLRQKRLDFLSAACEADQLVEAYVRVHLAIFLYATLSTR